MYGSGRRSALALLTPLRLAEEFAYLAIVLDAFSRKVIGWAMATHLKAELAIAALDQAIAVRQPPPGSVIHHSDRADEYEAGLTRLRQDPLAAIQKENCP